MVERVVGSVCCSVSTSYKYAEVKDRQEGKMCGTVGAKYEY